MINRRSFGWSMDFVVTPASSAVRRVVGGRCGVAGGHLSGLARQPDRARRGAAGGLMRAALIRVLVLAAARGAAASATAERDRGRASLEHGSALPRRRRRRRFRARDGAARVSFSRGPRQPPEYRTEWWYFTGNLATASGPHFGFELTFFRYALAPRATPRDGASAWRAEQVWMAHFALTDVGGRSVRRRANA